MSGQDENSGADDAADAERNQVERGQCSSQWWRLPVHPIALSGLAQQDRGGFASPDIGHRGPLPHAGNDALPLTIRSGL
jgi:hypothetical protein